MSIAVGDWVRLKTAYRGCRIGRVSEAKDSGLYLVDVDASLGVACARSDISRLHQQAEPHRWFPMRKTLPYGHYVCADGSQVAFNRDYEPIFRIDTDGEVSRCDPGEWIDHVSETRVYDQERPPWEDESTFQICVQHVPDDLQPPP